MYPAWIDMDKREVLQEADTEAAATFIPLLITHLPNNTPNPERLLVPLVSVDPLSLIHTLMNTPFLSLANVWYILDAKVQEMVISQQLVLFIEWLQACTFTPQRSIDALISVDLVDLTLEQRQEIRTHLIPPPPPP